MTKEQIAVIEHSIEGLKKETWFMCRGCPIQEKCEMDEDAYSPPCEKWLFEAIKIVKGLCE